jgi:hypothetical protein
LRLRRVLLCVRLKVKMTKSTIETITVYPWDAETEREACTWAQKLVAKYYPWVTFRSTEVAEKSSDGKTFYVQVEYLG